MWRICGCQGNFLPRFSFVQHDSEEFMVEDLAALYGVKSSADLFRFVLDDELAPMFWSEHEASVRSVSAEFNSKAVGYFNPSGQRLHA